MTDALETVCSTGQPAFAVDLAGQILAWNAAAEALFRYTAREAIGRRCWQLLRGRDVHGNDYCAKSCPLRQMVCNHRPINPAALVFRTAHGQRVKLRVFLLVLAGETPAESVIAHLLCPLDTEGSSVATPKSRGGNRTTDRLTRREFEVLGLLVEGRATQHIAGCLGVSGATIRNHVQNILRKLGVHSRLEAVALFRDSGLQH